MSERLFQDADERVAKLRQIARDEEARNVQDADLIERLANELHAARTALQRIAAQQPRTLEGLESHGIVFDAPLGRDPSNWQHVAFSIYTDLCEVDMWARQALVVEDDDA